MLVNLFVLESELIVMDLWDAGSVVQSRDGGHAVIGRHEKC